MIPILLLILIVVVVLSILTAWLAHLWLKVVVFVVVHLNLHHLLLVEHVCIDVALVDVEHSLCCALLFVAFVSASSSVTASGAVLFASSCAFESQLGFIIAWDTGYLLCARCTSRVVEGVEGFCSRLGWEVATDTVAVLSTFELSWYWSWNFSGQLLISIIFILLLEFRILRTCWLSSAILAPFQLHLKTLCLPNTLQLLTFLRRSTNTLNLLNLLFEYLVDLLLLLVAQAASWSWLSRSLLCGSFLSLEDVGWRLSSSLVLVWRWIFRSFTLYDSLRRILWPICIMESLILLIQKRLTLFLRSRRCLWPHRHLIRAIEQSFSRSYHRHHVRLLIIRVQWLRRHQNPLRTGIDEIVWLWSLFLFHIIIFKIVLV